jgi:hypothetical protein
MNFDWKRASGAGATVLTVDRYVTIYAASFVWDQCDRARAEGALWLHRLKGGL